MVRKTSSQVRKPKEVELDRLIDQFIGTKNLAEELEPEEKKYSQFLKPLLKVNSEARPN